MNFGPQIEKVWEILDEFDVYGRNREKAEKKIIKTIEYFSDRSYRRGLKDGKKIKK
jgi:hypothetical protein